jgi:hypothetical protein
MAIPHWRPLFWENIGDIMWRAEFILLSKQSCHVDGH